MALQRLKEKPNGQRSNSRLPEAKSICRSSRLALKRTRPLVLKLTRAKLEQLVGDLIQKTIEPCRKIPADAGVSAQGHSGSRPGRRHDPYAESHPGREDFFGKEPHRGVNAESSRSTPASRAASSKRRSGRAVARRNPLSLGIGHWAGVFTKLIERNDDPDEEEPGVLRLPTTRPPSPSRVFQGDVKWRTTKASGTV